MAAQHCKRVASIALASRHEAGGGDCDKLGFPTAVMNRPRISNVANVVELLTLLRRAGEFLQLVGDVLEILPVIVVRRVQLSASVSCSGRDDDQHGSESPSSKRFLQGHERPPSGEKCRASPLIARKSLRISIAC
jgi:hypothetical protein